MRALHLFSNWKWTGPAELAVNAVRGLRSRGVDARLAVGRTPSGEPGKTTVTERAIERGVTPILPELRLSKHVAWIGNWLDARALRAYTSAQAVDLVHAHLPNCHSIARRALGAKGKVRLVRSSYDGGEIQATIRQRRALACTDALVCASREALADAVTRLSVPEDRVRLIEPPVDTARFDAARGEGLRAEGRRLLGLEGANAAPGSDAYVVGIVARMQTHRNFDVFLEAVRRAHEALPGMRAVVIGRGTNQEVVAKEPARRLGLGEVVRFPGYLDGESYVAALAALDAKIFLVPGSDGSCRAVREALCMGLPVIAARRGMLAEIVKDGETGALVADGDAEALAAAIVRLGRDEGLRRAQAARAREDGRARFSIERATDDLLQVYEAALARPRRGER